MLLITRPIEQTKNLESILLVNGIDFAFFPAFEIKKLKPLVLKQNYDVIIFISVNAVIYAEEYNKLKLALTNIFETLDAKSRYENAST